MSQFYKSGNTQSYTNDRDVKRDGQSMGFKRQSSGPWADTDREDVCPECKTWEELDSFGYCKNIECRRIRLVRALVKGEAMCLENGTIVWTPGRNIRAIDEKK